MRTRPFSIAFIVRDPLPPLRADVATLFGVEMPSYGVHTELVGQGGGTGSGPWRAGGMHVVGSLVIAGEAPSVDEMVWMRNAIAARGLGHHVLLTGWLPQAAALGYAVRAEVGLSPIPRGRLYDVSSPTRLVEYLALGIPGVANDIPDQRRVIEESGAGLCVPMEAEAFADATLRLLRDPGLAAHCAERGPPWVRKNRTYDILAREVALSYHRMLAPGEAVR